MKSCITAALILILSGRYAFAQEFAFELSSHPRFARAIRLGNAYTGVAEGPEAMYYNTAGLANMNYYCAQFSSGQGEALFMDKYSANDYAVAAPLPDNLGTVGLSLNYTSLDYSDVPIVYGKDIEAVYSIHYARQLNNSFSAGIKISSYVKKFEIVRYMGDLNTGKEFTGQAFDFSLSALFNYPGFNPKRDLFRAGLQLTNITNTKVKFENLPDEDRKFQQIRIGSSYSFSPALNEIYGFVPITLLISGDLVYKGGDYKFDYYDPNFGVEITFLEMLQISFGRENESIIGDAYFNSLQHPVNRYGIGINIPFNRMMNVKYPLELNMNYTISDWDNINENNIQIIGGYLLSNKIKKEAFSAGIKLFL